MATSNSVKSALANTIIRTAVNKSKGANNNWYANRLSRLLEKYYGNAPVTGVSKLLSTNASSSVSIVAPKGRPVRPVVVPTKMAHPEKVRLSIDTRHLYIENNLPNTVTYSLKSILFPLYCIKYRAINTFYIQPKCPIFKILNIKFHSFCHFI